MTYVTYNKAEGEVEIHLPDEARHLSGLVQADLEAEFAFEPMVDKVIQSMNLYVANWLYGRGIGNGEVS